MSNPFAAPATADGITWSDLNGRLLLIEPHKQEFGMKTSFGESDPVRATVAVLDGPEAGEVYADTLIFPKVLIGQTAPKVGEKILARLGQGNAKPGQSAPWLLTEPTAADVEVGKQWLTKQQTATTGPAAADTDVPF